MGPESVAGSLGEGFNPGLPKSVSLRSAQIIGAIRRAANTKGLATRVARRSAWQNFRMPPPLPLFTSPSPLPPVELSFFVSLPLRCRPRWTRLSQAVQARVSQPRTASPFPRSLPSRPVRGAGRNKKGTRRGSRGAGARRRERGCDGRGTGTWREREGERERAVAPGRSRKHGDVSRCPARERANADGTRRRGSAGRADRGGEFDGLLDGTSRRESESRPRDAIPSRGRARFPSCLRER